MIKPIHILLVEDNEGDIILTREALSEGRIHNRVSEVRDGQKALDYLFRRNGYEQAERPDLILLDLNLPKTDGFDVLSVIKQEEELKNIPVVILTTSSAEKDVLLAYNKYANCYISKPVNLEQFMDVVRVLEDFWISIVKLPRKPV